MVTTSATSSRDPELTAHLESLCGEVQYFLESAKKSINDEIDVYPKPIPRCDAQFNFLYEQRARLVSILAKLDEVSVLRGTPGELVERLAQFAASIPVSDDPRERTLRERIGHELSKLSQEISAK